MIKLTKIHFVLSTLVLSFSVLTLQLGFSYWISGATLGALTLVLLAFHSGLHVVWLKRPLYLSFLLWISGVLLAARILSIDDRPLYQARLVFFLFLYVLSFAGAIFMASDFRWSRLVPPIIYASLIVNIFLFIFYVLTLLPGSPLAPERLVFFLDRFLVANKTFSSLDVAFNAFRHADLLLYKRVSLLFGEPSYLAFVVGVTTFNLVTSLRLVQFSRARPSFSAFPRRFLIVISILCGFILLVISGSVYGLAFLVFLFLLLLLLTTLFKGPILYLSIAAACASILVGLDELIPSGFAEYTATRISDIFSGSDLSSSGRVYPFLLLFDQGFDTLFFGFGGATREALESSGFTSADVGIVSFMLSYGLLFFLFLSASILSIFYGFRRTSAAFSYCVLIIFVWSQSGNILSVDKFFMSVLPVPLLSLELVIRKSFVSLPRSIPCIYPALQEL